MATKPSVVSTTASKYKGKSIQTLSDGTKVRVNTGTNKSGSGSKNAINTASTSSLASERFDLDTPLAAPQAPTAPVSTPPVPYSQQTPPPLANGNYNITTGNVNYQFDQSGNLVGSGAATYKTPPIPNVESLRTPVTSADALTSFIMEMDKSNKAAQREYLKSLEPTKNENKLQERIDNILSSSEQGLLNAEGRVVPMQAIIGEQQLIEKRTQTLLAPLQRELERAVSARESKTKALGTALDFREKNQNLQFQILKEIQAPILEAQKETRSFARTLLTKYPDIAPYIDINSMSAEDIAGMVSSRSKIFQLEQSDAGLDRDLKRAQLAKIYSDISPAGTGGTVPLTTQQAITVNQNILGNDSFKAIRASRETIESLKNLSSALKNYRVYSPGSQQGYDQKVALSGLYEKALLNSKEFFNLGVLQKIDKDELDKLIADPSNPANIGKLATNANRRAYTSAIDNLVSEAIKKTEAEYGVLKDTFGVYDPKQVTALNAARNYMDYFGNNVVTSMLEQASPEQLQILRSEGLIQ